MAVVNTHSRHARRLRPADAAENILKHNAVPRLRAEALCREKVNIRRAFAVLHLTDRRKRLKAPVHAVAFQHRLVKLRRRRGGDSHFDPAPRKERKVFPHERLQPDVVLVLIFNHARPLLNQVFRRVRQAIAANGIIRRLAEIHRPNSGGIIRRQPEAAPAEKALVNVGPHTHRIDQRAVKVKNCRVKRRKLFQKILSVFR